MDEWFGTFLDPDEYDRKRAAAGDAVKARTKAE